MFFMSKNKPEEKPKELTTELTTEQRRYKITELLQNLSNYEKGVKTFGEKGSQVKVEFCNGNYNYHYFPLEMAESALKGLFFVRIAEIKQELLALGVQA